MPSTIIGNIRTASRTLDIVECVDGGMLWWHTPGGAYATTAVEGEAPTEEQRNAACATLVEQVAEDEEKPKQVRFVLNP